MISSNAIITDSYSHSLVTLPVLIVISASYAAIDLADRVTAARGVIRSMWLAGGITAIPFSGVASAPGLTDAGGFPNIDILAFLLITCTVLVLALLKSGVAGWFGARKSQLQTSEQSMRQIVESSQVILWCRSIATSRLIFVNSKAETLLGYELEQWDQPSFWTDHVYPEDRSLVEASLVKVLDNNEPQSFEHRMIAADGRVIWLSTSLRVTGTRENARQLVGAMTDITQRKQAQEAAQLVKNNFLANISHEIRTPMNGILGMSELVLGSVLDGEQRECMEMLRSSADSLLTVLNGILDFSKIESGKLELQTAPFNLRDLLAACAKTLAEGAQQKGLALVYHLAAGVPEGIVGDRSRLRQIILNLAGNAIKFTERGEISILVQMDQNDAGSGRPDQVNLRFSVCDSGIGIPREDQQAVFQPFTQGDASTTRRFGGTGLGLSICAHLVSMMHGRIWFDSQVGQGSRFYFTGQFGQAKNIGKEESRLAGLAVLVVDEGMLNGGLALAEELKQQTSRPPAAIVLEEANDSRDETARASDWGTMKFCKKPMSKSDLHATLLNIVDCDFSKSAAGVAAKHQDAENEPDKALHILLVDDDHVTQRLAHWMLEKQGHRVTIASNGREALEKLHLASFDVILMDLQMPEMDGLEATAHIRRNEEGTGGHQLIVAVTAHAFAGDRERCLAAGMDDYVAKPIDQAELIAILNKLRTGWEHSATNLHYSAGRYTGRGLA